MLSHLFRRSSPVWAGGRHHMSTTSSSHVFPPVHLPVYQRPSKNLDLETRKKSFALQQSLDLETRRATVHHRLTALSPPSVLSSLGTDGDFFCTSVPSDGDFSDAPRARGPPVSRLGDNVLEQTPNIPIGDLLEQTHNIPIGDLLDDFEDVIGDEAVDPGLTKWGVCRAPGARIPKKANKGARPRSYVMRRIKKRVKTGR